MQSISHSELELILKVNTQDLTPAQVRALKAIHTLVCNVLAAEDEAEYFDCSAGLLKKTAELIKTSQFAETNPEMSYGNQAVEFAIDSLTESIEEDKFQNFDN